MNLLIVEAKHNGLYREPIRKYNSTIDNSTIQIESRRDNITIQVLTRKGEPAAVQLFLDIFSVLYIYFGAFPAIESATFNGNTIDRSNWIEKYASRSDLFRNNLFIADINSASINQSVIDSYRKKQLPAIYSLQYLTCESYRKVISDHRLTLLLHIIDGIIELDKKAFTQLSDEMIAKYNIDIKKGKPGEYITKAYAISKECFFYYHRKYNCEILRLLNTSQYAFLQIITDTRNWNSHFLRDKKPDRLKRGTEIVIFFEILQYVLRLKITKDIGAPIKESNVKEYYYVLHDWILEALYNSNENFKSNTYKAAKQWKEFIRQMNRYIESQSIVGTEDTVINIIN